MRKALDRLALLIAALVAVVAGLAPSPSKMERGPGGEACGQIACNCGAFAP